MKISVRMIAVFAPILVAFLPTAARAENFTISSEARLAMDKITARLSAKRRRIQLPPNRESRILRSCAPFSDDLRMLRDEGLGVNPKNY